MNRYNLLIILFLSLFIVSCKSNSGEKTSEFSVAFNREKAEFRLQETMEIMIKNPKNRTVDSVRVYLGRDLIASGSEAVPARLFLKDQKLGNRKISAVIYQGSKKDSISREVKIFNDSPPAIYTYRIINTYPHDPAAYTQGLEFYRDTLYESTGQFGSSSLRKTDYTSGEVIKKVALADKYFGEGITVLDDKIYQLTWQGGKGFIYDAATLEQTGSFYYENSKEGWGLCNDGKQFYKSDGTDKIWTLDKNTLAEKSYIQPTTHRSISTQLNELEWVEGRIYANTYQKDGVAIINPENGAIEGIIDFKGLRDLVDQHPALDVLNGIAYNPETKKLYVTGKNWNKLFEVEIERK